MRLYDLANEELRRMYLERAKRQGWRGWEGAGPQDVAHLVIRDDEVIALCGAIERFIVEKLESK